MPRPAEWPELGHDEFDLPPTAQAPVRWLPYRRLALGARASATPTTVFILAGAALGPSGLHVLSDALILRSQALVWVGLAVTGVFIGLGLVRLRSQLPRELLAWTCVTALLAIGAVAGAFYVLAASARLPLPGALSAGALFVALCASVSAAVPTSASSRPQLLRASAVADADDVPLLVVGLVALASVTGEAGASRALATVMAGVAIGLAGCLLFSRASDVERGLFVTSAVLLLAGAASYLGTSPLVSGCAAALVWSGVPGPADRITARDLRVLQHPLVVIILVVAGATVEWTMAALWAAAIVVVLRLAAKVLVAVTVSRMAAVSPALLASVLLQPGVLGIALALNAWLVLGEAYRWVVSAVTLATMASEALALFLSPSNDAGA